ncbi:hypothetical protein DFH09DRAFT_1428016 [Mycena vulgaris]|nr:hypothetical protein DFH09DRAFT_1428016 [Mycena vulgaris]
MRSALTLAALALLSIPATLLVAVTGGAPWLEPPIPSAARHLDLIQRAQKAGGGGRGCAKHYEAVLQHLLLSFRFIISSSSSAPAPSGLDSVPFEGTDLMHPREGIFLALVSTQRSRAGLVLCVCHSQENHLGITFESSGTGYPTLLPYSGYGSRHGTRLMSLLSSQGRAAPISMQFLDLEMWLRLILWAGLALQIALPLARLDSYGESLMRTRINSFYWPSTGDSCAYEARARPPLVPEIPKCGDSSSDSRRTSNTPQNPSVVYVAEPAQFIPIVTIFYLDTALQMYLRHRLYHPINGIRRRIQLSVCLRLLEGQPRAHSSGVTRPSRMGANAISGAMCACRHAGCLDSVPQGARHGDDLMKVGMGMS